MWKSLKRWPIRLALLVAAGLLTVAILPLSYGGRVTRANCERIKEGMTEVEVRAILGKPWENSLLDPELSLGDLTEAEFVWEQMARQESLDFSFGREQRAKRVGRLQNVRIWMSGKVVIFVDFDDDNRVIVAGVCSDRDRPRSWLPELVWRRLLVRLGWWP